MPENFTTVSQPIVKKFGARRKANVRRASFEGGYSQRSSTGPNSVDTTLRLTWQQKNEDIDTIDAFLTARRGVEAFYYRLPNDTIDRLWTCDDWSISDAGPSGTQLVATFKREFDIV